MQDERARAVPAKNEFPNPGQPANIGKWPAWYFGPEGASEIFQSADEVPQGWEDSSTKVGKAPVKGEQQPKADDAYTAMDNETLKKELDGRKLSYQVAWPDDKLRALLRADDDAKAKKGK